MIAYNICYSTCLGRVEKFKGTDKFGFTELKVADGMIELLKDYLTGEKLCSTLLTPVTPNGMIFVKPAVRKSLLAKMLGEVLDTRVMVKNAMKGARQQVPTQMLNARQLGLKLMAVSTATPSLLQADAPERDIRLHQRHILWAHAVHRDRRLHCPDWKGDTREGARADPFSGRLERHSRVWRHRLALHLASGRSKEQAFKIGHDIADTVTAMNPKPVKLKFEKVYMGSVLMAKKRYVGFKYERPDETEPVFDAKGIETIRRDGFAAQQKMEEVCLKMLFRNQDLSEIKDFCRQEWTKILQGRVSPQDFIIAKEVRLGTYS
jgi:DNA polymerase zeta